MPADAVIVVAGITALFLVFGIALAVVSWKTNRP